MLKTELLKKAHDRKNFDCGQEDLNRYLKETALQHINKKISKTFVFVDDEDKNDLSEILGFQTLAIYEAATSDLPSKVAKKYPTKTPGILLGRLAVSVAHQNKKIGTRLLFDACEKVARISDHVGVFALFVDAKDEAARSFYEYFGFLPFPNYNLKMYLPLTTIKSLLEE